MASSVITGSRGESKFCFVRNSETVFQSGLTLLHAPPPAVNESSRGSTASPAFHGVSVLDFDNFKTFYFEIIVDSCVILRNYMDRYGHPSTIPLNVTYRIIALT